ncbi:MAG: hypothetical protein Q4D81_13220 [Eubacteriales bacterium]|nr:hypothetical protein [Eubacteriales bacterium]
MRRILTGQILLVVCCLFYLIWWYRGYRPGVTANRVDGTNGVLLLITAALGVAGLSFSLMRVPETTNPRISPVGIVNVGILSYFILLLITRYAFHRIVTTELILIVGWTMLEMTVINRLNAACILSGRGFEIMCIVIAAAFLISMVLYVAYYRMEEMKAFYAAMVPLVTEAFSMVILAGMLLAGSR